MDCVICHILFVAVNNSGHIQHINILRKFRCNFIYKLADLRGDSAVGNAKHAEPGAGHMLQKDNRIRVDCPYILHNAAEIAPQVLCKLVDVGRINIKQSAQGNAYNSAVIQVIVAAYGYAYKIRFLNIFGDFTALNIFKQLVRCFGGAAVVCVTPAVGVGNYLAVAGLVSVLYAVAL